MVRLATTSLRLRLLALVVIALLPACAAVFAHYLAERDQIRAQAGARTQALAQQVASEHTQLLGTTRQLLLTLTRLPEVQRPDPAGCSRLFAELVSQHVGYVNLGVADRDGAVWCSAKPLQQAISIAEREYFQQTREGGSFTVGVYQVGRITGQPTLNVAAPVVDAAGHFQGVAFAALDLAWLTQLVSSAPLPAGAGVVVIDRDGTVLAQHPDAGQVGQPAEAPLVQALLAQSEGLVELRGPNGTPRQYAFAPFGWGSAPGLASVAVGIPLEVAFAKAERELAVSLAAFGVVSLLALAVTWTSANLLVLQPVRQLVRATQQLQAGDRSVRTGLTAAHGELGELGRAFDALANALQHHEQDRSQAEAALRRSKTELEQTLATLRQAQEQVVQQERLSALGQMASGIAHDFNNALAPIVAYSELLLVRPRVLEDSDKAREYLDGIHAASRQAVEVVQRLREFYRAREAHEPLEAVRLADVVAQAVSLTQFSWRNQALGRGIVIDLVTEIDQALCVPGEASELREVLTNLILNAVDALPRGGQLALRARAEGGQVVLEVADTGVGMSEATRRRCLEPFFTTKGEHGTGLGLAVVWGIVRRHRGTVAVESQPGEGTTITIRLPLADQVPSAQPSCPDRSAEPAQCPLRVLVVDDEPLVRSSLAEYLELDGHRVELASSGQEGLEKFRAGRFDLVLTDRAMPELGGDELALAIRQLEPGIPIVMLTGFGDLMTSSGERPLGVDLVLSKPITLPALRAAIAAATADDPQAPPGAA